MPVVFSQISFFGKLYQYTQLGMVSAGSTQQLVAHSPVCTDVACGRAGLLDSCTPAGVPAPAAPLCVRQSALTAPSGEHHPLQAPDPPGVAGSGLVSRLPLFKCLRA